MPRKKPKVKRDPFHVNLSPEERRKLDHLAAVEDRTAADMMRQLISRAVQP